ncbi:hypothetical protein L596_012393 [Steinernema carpocapsae]|uniref:WAP domain-containing protein n=1 Tax=Steinernema carpocapsae TaxID=34508 RepID=A0A4U5NXR0_STECR|nr:hypothetical protein L596_012393 [Steinernema carpocapsae]
MRLHFSLLFVVVLGTTLGAAVHKQQFYQFFTFDTHWGACFAHKTANQKDVFPGSENPAVCRSMISDDPGCYGPEGSSSKEGRPKPGATTPYPSFGFECYDLDCDEGYHCERGAYGGGYCCSTEHQQFHDQGVAEKCPNGSKAEGFYDKLNKQFHTFVAKKCDDLLCGEGFKCVQVNKYFAKCCQLS